MHGAVRGGMALPPRSARMLVDPDAIDDFCKSVSRCRPRRKTHACTHMTIAPTIIHGGTKLNVIPISRTGSRRADFAPSDETEVALTPRRSHRGPRRQGRDPVGPRRPCKRVPGRHPSVGRLDAMVRRFHPGAQSVPYLCGSDGRAVLPSARGGRVRLRDVLDRLSFEQFLSMFHGDDERVDVESLALSARCSRLCPARSWPEPSRSGFGPFVVGIAVARCRAGGKSG